MTGTESWVISLAATVKGILSAVDSIRRRSGLYLLVYSHVHPVRPKPARSHAYFLPFSRRFLRDHRRFLHDL